MRNILSKINKLIPILLISLVIFSAALPLVHAQAGALGLAAPFVAAPLTKAVIAGISASLNDSLETIAIVILSFLGWILAQVGILLNVAMYLTTHIDPFIRNTPVIFTTWGIIRDVASMILIFTILWAAIEMILDIRPANYSNLLKSIVIMGILINFSFFFAEVMIDASNIVSLQFYNAIAPNSTASDQTDISKLVKDLASGTSISGVSDVFVNTLSLPGWFSNKQQLTEWGQESLKNNTSAAINETLNAPLAQTIRLVMLTMSGSIIYVSAIISFLVATAAALWRFIILVILLCFSPIWIAAMAMPQLSTFSKRWWGSFKNQLLFLPAYLIVMYVVLMVISGSKLGSVSNVGGDTTVYFINLFVSSVIILTLINLPIVAAAQFAGHGSEWTEKMYNNMRSWANKWTVGKVRQAGTALGGYAARRTIGAGASIANKTFAGTKFGNSLLGRDVRKATLGKVASSKFGTKRSYEDYTKEQKDVKKKQVEIDRRNELAELLTLNNVTMTPDQRKKIKESVGKMNKDEKLNQVQSVIKDQEKLNQVLKYMSSKDFEAIKDSDWSDEDKEKIKEARKDALTDTLANIDPTSKRTREPDALKNIIKNMETGDLLGLDDATLTDPNLVANLTPNQLKQMADSGITTARKAKIKDTINNWLTAYGSVEPHPAFGYVNNDPRWK